MTIQLINTVIIADWAGKSLTITNPDETTSIADLAQFVTFIQDATSGWGVDIDPPHQAAFDALVEEYDGHESVGHSFDYHEGFAMTFSDGSEIRFTV